MSHLPTSLTSNTPQPLHFQPALSYTNHPDYIVWHHAGTGGDPSAQDIHRWHSRRVSDGIQWAGIGYHFVIRQDGTVEPGRPQACTGAHTWGLNSRSLGLCFTGNADAAPLSAAQIASGLALTRTLMDTHGLRAGQVIGHREVNELVNRGLLPATARTGKTCPGSHTNMARVRATLYATSPFKTGVDVMRDTGWSLLKHLRIGLVSNHTSKDTHGEFTWKLMRTTGLDLRTLFAIEHGLSGGEQGEVTDSQLDGIPVVSLHTRASKKPSAQQLADLDAIVWDIQDSGVRFFTHGSSLVNLLKACAIHRKKLVILDRPNPLGGFTLEGPVLPATRVGFNVGPHTIPIRHALTLGELARLVNAELGLGADLHAVAMQGWDAHLGMPIDLPWQPLSPNLVTIPATLLYAGIGLLEPYLKGLEFDIGRGTPHAFQRLGAPWLDGQKLAAELGKSALAGVEVSPVRFTVKKHAAKAYEGIALTITHANQVRPVQLALAIASAIWRLHPTVWSMQPLGVQLTSPTAIAQLENGASSQRVVEPWATDAAEFAKRCETVWLYSR